MTASTASEQEPSRRSPASFSHWERNSFPKLLTMTLFTVTVRTGTLHAESGTHYTASSGRGKPGSRRGAGDGHVMSASRVGADPPTD